MQAIWVLAVLALASADVSHLGYNYKVPHTSYGFPSYQEGSNSGHYHSVLGGSVSGIYKGAESQYLGSSLSHGDTGVPSHLTGDAHRSASSLNSGFTTGSLSSGYNSGSSSGYGSSLTSGYGSGFSSGLSGGSGLSSGQYYHTVNGPSTVQPIYVGESNHYQSTQYQSGEKYQQFYQVQSNEPTKVYKHFYVHTAPEELEVPKPRTPIVLPPPQKHYKIIFVKTPSPASQTSHIVPVQPQNEEKTIVYVLVKKPEEHHEVIVPKVEQKPPTKPEVYFVKYNNKEDSQAVISNIVNDYNKPGQSVSFSSGGSEGSSVLSGFPSVGSGYVSGSSGHSDGASNYAIPSGGFSNGFSKYPTSSTLLNIPSSSSFSSSTDSGIASGSGLSGIFGSSHSSSVPAPIVSSLGSSQAFASTSDATNSGQETGAEASSLYNGVSSPSISTTITSEQSGFSTVPGVQGLPHETYGVPKFRTA